LIINSKNRVFTKEKKILFLHGYLADSRSFFNQIRFFERDFEVFAPDLKGFGQNSGMQTPYSLDDYIAEVEEFKYKNSLNSPNVIAHSFGGRIAIKATAKNQNFCNRLVLTGAAGLKPKNTVKKRLKKTAFNILKTFIKKEKLKVFYSKDYLALDSVMKESFKKIIAENLDGYLKDIKNQTLVIFGENDLETPLYMAKRLGNGIEKSRLVVIKDAGHFCFIDKPHEFNLEVKEFLLS
jgi:pimeloyl-ACP methyl ester carboxylesterase